MSKSTKSNKWFVRIDGNQEHLTNKLKALSTAIDTIAILGAFHLGSKKENPHCHFVIETASLIQKQSFAIRIKDLFVITKRSEYALNVWDGERGTGAVSYLFHETDAKILVNKGFTDGDIERAKLANDAVQRVVAINKEKASQKLVDKTYEYLTENKMSYSHFESIRFMLNEIKKGNNYHPGEYMLKKYCEEIEVRMSENLDDLTQNVIMRLWR